MIDVFHFKYMLSSYEVDLSELFDLQANLVQKRLILMLLAFLKQLLQFKYDTIPLFF